MPLIEYTESRGKPLIISTGIADASDIQAAVDACRRMGNNDITLLRAGLQEKWCGPYTTDIPSVAGVAETFLWIRQ